MQAVRGKQEEILKLYHWDIAQYDPDNKLYLDEIFDLIPTELNAKNKRFIYNTLCVIMPDDQIKDDFW